MQVAVVTGNNCKYCDEVKDHLKIKAIDYKEFNLNSHPDIKTFFINSGFTTVPQVFVDGKLLGGCAETMKWLYG